MLIRTWIILSVFTFLSWSITTTGTANETIKGISQDPQRNYLPTYTAADFQQQLNDGRLQSKVHEVINETTYVVGPGDVFKIHFLATKLENEILAAVNPEGNLVIPHVGMVRTNRPLLEVKQGVLDLIGGKSRKNDILVELYEVRGSLVSISGEVPTPGTYEFLSTVRLSDVILRAFKDDLSLKTEQRPSLRNIRVFSVRGEPRSYDLQDFLLNSDKTGDPFLFCGERVEVPIQTCSLAVSGAVVRPGVYDYRDEPLVDLIRFAGGFLPEADSSKISVISYKPDRVSLETRQFLFPGECDGYRMRPDDRVIVGTRPDWRSLLSVNITGRVRNAGIYNVEKGTTVRQLVERAGGLLEDADVDAMYVSRPGILENGVSDSYQLLLGEANVPNLQVLSSQFADKPGSHVIQDGYTLEDGDVVFVPKQLNSVCVFGTVHRPGVVPFKSGEDWEWYVDQTGGFDHAAMKSKAKVYKKKSGIWVYADGAESIDPGDILYIPEIPPNYYWEKIKDAITITSGIISITVTLMLLTRGGL